MPCTGTQRSPRGEKLQVMPDQPLSRAEGAWLLRQVPRARDNQALVRLLERWRTQLESGEWNNRAREMRGDVNRYGGESAAA